MKKIYELRFLKTTSFKSKKLNFTIILALIFLLLSINMVSANEPTPKTLLGVGQDTCPDSGDWTKIDLGGEPLSYTVNAPAGKLIVETCYKAGNSVIYDGPFDPGVSSYTFNSEVPNPNGNAYQALSHVSYRLADVNYATASAVVEACVDGSTTTPVNLSVTGATMYITGPFSYNLLSGENYTAIDWPAGTYAISYVMDTGYTDPGNLPTGFTVAECSTKEDAEAEAKVEACVEGSITTPVSLSVTGATMNITGPFSYTLLSGESYTAIDWPAGTYAISYVMETGYTDPGNLPTGFTVAECSTKEDAEAEAKVEACVEGSITTPVSLSVTGATMNITGPSSYTLLSGESYTAIDWPAGTYSISYVIEEGYNDPGNLPTGFTIEDCSTKEDAEASATVEACIEGSISTPVVLWVDGASMTITLAGDPSFLMEHSGGPTTYKNLVPGTYNISYTFDEGYKDPGTLPSSFVIEECEEDKGFLDISVTVKCIYDPGNICHTWTVSNPNDFPVDFEWSTGTKGGDYSDSGSGTVDALGKYIFTTSYLSQTMVVTYSDGEVVRVVTVESGACTIDYEEPDEPAGGSGPSLIVTLTPALLTVSGVAVAWRLTKNKNKKI